MPVYIFHGEEEFEISRAVDAMKQKLVDPAWASFNLARIDGGDLKHIVEAASSVPFGPGNKVFVFERCDLFTKKRGGKSDDDGEKTSASKVAKVLEDLDSTLGTVASNTYLLFECIANFDTTLKISKVFAKHAKFEKFEKKKYYSGSPNKELLTWANKEAHRFSATMDDDAISYLAESTEVNLRQMSQEIEKAATFILPDTHITLKTVSQLSPHFSHVFALLDYWAYGKKAKVLEAIQELQSRQISAHVVIATLQTTLSKWISYKTEMERAMASSPGSRDVNRREVPLGELARQIAFDPRMAFVVEQDLKRIKSMPLEYLVNKKRELTELEHSIKTGQMPETHALSLFFTR